MSKGTILYVGGFELPDKNAAAHRVLNNGKIFRTLGYNVVFIGVAKDLGYGTSVSASYIKNQDFDMWLQPYPLKCKHWVQYFSSIHPITEVIGYYNDVKAIICYNYQSPALINLLNYCKKRKIKVIADCTEWYGVQGKNIVMKAIKGIDSFVRMRILHKKLDGLIVISKYLLRYYNKYTVLLIPPLVDLSEPKWNVKSHCNDKLNLIYSGSPGFKKDKLNLIIRCLYALKNSTDFLFKIVGITAEQYLKYYPEDNGIIKELSSRVCFMGRTSHSDSIKNISEADASIFVRSNNIINRAGFPTKLVESISCGIPVITNKTSNIPDYIKPGVNGYLLDSDIEKSLSELIITKKSELKEMKNKVVKDVFDYRKYKDSVDGFLKRLEI